MLSIQQNIMNQDEQIRKSAFMIILLFLLLSGLVVTSITGHQICANFRIKVSYEERDIEGQRTETRNVYSSEKLQKKVKEYSFSLGGSIDIKLFSVNNQNTFKWLTETENLNKEYQSSYKSEETTYSKDSRQLFRVQETVMEVYRYTSTGVDRGLGSVKKEEYVDAILKKDCKVMDEQDLYDESVKFIKNKYGDKNGTIDKNVYTEENCVGM